jgi:hypothetical protein
VVGGGEPVKSRGLTGRGKEKKKKLGTIPEHWGCHETRAGPFGGRVKGDRFPMVQSEKADGNVEVE